MPLWRCSDPAWDDPLDGSHSMRFGARCNRARSFPVTYLNVDLGTARAQGAVHLHLLAGKLRGQPFMPRTVSVRSCPYESRFTFLIALTSTMTRDAIVLNGLLPTCRCIRVINSEPTHHDAPFKKFSSRTSCSFVRGLFLPRRARPVLLPVLHALSR